MVWGKIKALKPFLLFGLVLFVTHGYTILTNHSLMIFNTDSYSQMLQFYLGGWEKFHALNFSGWDWSSGYGGNYFNYVYYFASSPFFFITLFFDKSAIPYLVLYLNALKLFLIFSFSYLWLNRLSHSSWISTVGALILSFSGWVTFLYHYSMFLDGFLMYPLILWAMDVYLEEKKPYFSLFIGLLGIINYYLMYMFIPFIIIYTVMRYFFKHTHLKWKSFFLEMIQMAGWSLLGLGLSAVVLFPSIAIILQTPRLQSSVPFFQTLDPLSIYRYVSTLFTPTVAWDNPSYFIPLRIDQGLGWGGGISVYSFYLFVLIAPNILFIKPKRERNILISTYLLLFLFASFLGFYKLFQGTIDVRWYYMFLFLNVYSLVFILKEMVSKKPRLIALNWLFAMGMLWGLYYFSLNHGFVNEDERLILNRIVSYGSLLLSLYSILLYGRFTKVLVFIVMLEASLSFLIPLWMNPPISYLEFKDRFQQELAPNEAIEYLKKTDQGFYRILQDNLGGYNLNAPFANQYLGVTFYASVYNFEMDDFIHRFTDKWLLPFVYGRTNTNIISSAKYYIQTNPSISVPFGFDYYKTIGSTVLYRNRYFIPLGYSTSDTFNQEAFLNLSLYEQDQLWLSAIVTDESTQTILPFLSQKRILAVNDDDGYLYVDDPSVLSDALITIENKGVPYITTNRINGNEINTEYHYQYDYFQTMIRASENLSAFEIVTTNPYGSSVGMNVYVEDVSRYETWYSNLNMFQNVEFNYDTLKASITITQPTAWVATSIPYDQGWKVWVDGKLQKITKVNLGFVGFELTEGNHELVFKYNVPYLREGMITSFTSVVLILLLFLRQRKAQLTDAQK